MKFNRQFKLTVDLMDGSEAIVITNPFTIELQVNRTADKKLNQMSVTVHNLSPKTRNRIFKDRFSNDKYRRVKLEAGYGQTLSLVYVGAIYEANSELSGANVMTHIISRDGGYDVPVTQTYRTIQAGTTLKEVKKGLINDFPNLQLGAIGGQDYTFGRPCVLDGNTFDILKSYSNGKCFIDQEIINDLEDFEVLPDAPFLINASTGLLDTPRRDDNFITLKTLFEPRVKMGQLVEIDSLYVPQYNGQYKVVGISHQGTISESVGGTLITEFNLLYGQELYGEFKKVE